MSYAPINRQHSKFTSKCIVQTIVQVQLQKHCDTLYVIDKILCMHITLYVYNLLIAED